MVNNEVLFLHHTHAHTYGAEASKHTHTLQIGAKMDELISCIEKCEGKTMKPNDIKEVFMYVKNYCKNSKAAAAESAKYETCVLDLRTKSFVASDDITQKKLKQDDPTCLLKAYNLLKEYVGTVPQVFVRDSKGWIYVGGSENFLTVSKMPGSGVKRKAELEKAILSVAKKMKLPNYDTGPTVTAKISLEEGGNYFTKYQINNFESVKYYAHAHTFLYNENLCDILDLSTGKKIRMNFDGLKKCGSLLSVKYFIGDFEVVLNEISQDNWKHTVQYLVDSEPKSIFLENRKGTRGAESDNLSACITREIGSYLEEDKISLLIKDMDDKEVCRIIPHRHLISLTPKRRRGKWEYVLPDHRYFVKFSVRGKETEPVLLDSIYAFKCLGHQTLARAFSDTFKIYLCHVNGTRIYVKCRNGKAIHGVYHLKRLIMNLFVTPPVFVGCRDDAGAILLSSS